MGNDKRLIITDISINPFGGPASFVDEIGMFALEGPDYATKTRFNVVYPTPVNTSFNSGLEFEPGEDVIIVVFLSPYSSFPARQYHVILSGYIVAN